MRLIVALIAIVCALVQVRASPLLSGKEVYLHEDASASFPRLAQVSGKSSAALDPHNIGLSTKPGVKEAHYATLTPDITWQQAHDYCGRFGYSLCEFKEVCNQGEGNDPIGADELPDKQVFVPIKGSSSNPNNVYLALTASAGDGVCTRKLNPDFGTSNKSPPKEITKSLVPCCTSKHVQSRGMKPGIVTTRLASDKMAQKLLGRMYRRRRRLDDEEALKRKEEEERKRKEDEARRIEEERKRVKDGSSPEQAAVSCNAIRKLDPSKYNKDGVYWLTFKNVEKPVKAFCILNPDVDGGGWTLALKSSRGTQFNFDSPHWTQSTLLNENDVSRGDSNAKFHAFNSLEATDLLGLWPDINRVGGSLNLHSYGCWTWMQKGFFNSRATTLTNFFSSVNNHHIGHPHHFTGWNAHGHPFSSQGCHAWYGFNYRLNNNARVRWGFGWNNECDAHSNDVSGGVGMNFRSYSAGDAINCCQNHAGINRDARVEIYVR